MEHNPPRQTCLVDPLSAERYPLVSFQDNLDDYKRRMSSMQYNMIALLSVIETQQITMEMLRKILRDASTRALLIMRKFQTCVELCWVNRKR